MKRAGRGNRNWERGGEDKLFYKEYKNFRQTGGLSFEMCCTAG